MFYGCSMSLEEQQKRTLMRGHSGAVYSVSYTQDSLHLLSASEDTTGGSHMSCTLNSLLNDKSSRAWGLLGIANTIHNQNFVPMLQAVVFGHPEGRRVALYSIDMQ